MKISVIIPTLNAEKKIIDLLNSLSNQSIKDLEIVIIDSGSVDKTKGIAAQKCDLFLEIKKEEFDHGGTRNFAANFAGSEYLVFLTQDALPVDNRTIGNLIKPMEDDAGIAVTYGRQTAYPSARPLEKFIREFNYPLKSMKKTRDDVASLGVKTFFCSNACAAYRKSVFTELGGFLSNTIMNEDMEFVHRAVMKGYSVFYAADATVYHSHDYSFSEQLKRYFDIGVFFADNPDIKAKSKNESEGFRYIVEACRFILGKKEYYELVYLVTDTLARLSGYRIGSRYRSLPAKVIKMLSMNKGYWNR
jgi:rhamnosyltransferase